MHSNNIAIIIPARIGSTRLPGKPLIKVNDKTIIQWVYERASKSKLAQSVIVATDNEDIFNEVQAFGGNVEMTSPKHQSGSDRIAEVVKRNPEINIAVNVQGDEPLINPVSIDKTIEALILDNRADISTQIRLIEDEDEINNPNIVKVVFDKAYNALYFSRSPIPYMRNKGETNYFAHIGLYVYRRQSLLRMTELPQAPLEKAESLEQLRALHSGMKIKLVPVNYKPIGIDTEEDLLKFKNIAENL